MSTWSELLDRAEPEAHFVQLYGEDDQLLTRNVSRYLVEGLRRGDGLVVFATSGHFDAIMRQLEAECPGAPEAHRQGRLVFHDARATLDRFMVDGQPDHDKFLSVVGPVVNAVRARSQSGGLRAFGEMVGLLWTDGRQAAAARLDDLWNELLVGSGCSLFCAYPIDILDGESHVGGLDAVLRSHTHMYAGPSTMLSGPWAPR
jgi:MEDS: MEthanogen/methylotroph, DcmR Sensory domain